MKKAILLFACMAFLLVGSSAFADVPTTMQFQGFLTDAQGTPLSGAHDITFSLYGSMDGQDSVWTDTYTLTLEMGAFSVVLGGEENPLDASVFAGAPLWLGISINNGAELSPRSLISSVPYATRAAIADNAMSQEQVQSLLDNGGYLTEVTETDPTVNALAKSVLGCQSGEVPKWDGANWVCATDQAGVFAEADPIFSESPAFGIDETDLTNWDACYAWGNHAEAGYLTYYDETDPSVNALAQALLDCAEGEIARFDGVDWLCSADGNTDTLASLECTNGETALWNETEETWECGAVVLTETDPQFAASPARAITNQSISEWNTAYGWGNHANEGYLKSYTETDPQFAASPANSITNPNISEWNTAYGWGNHAEAGYLTEYTETDPTVNSLAKAELSCTTDQIARFDGTQWVCSTDTNADTLDTLHANQIKPISAFADGNQSIKVTSSTAVVARSVSLTVPVAGTVVVNASAYCTPYTSERDYLRYSISRGAWNNTDYISHLGIWSEPRTGYDYDGGTPYDQGGGYWTVPDINSCGFYPFSQTRGFSVAAGTHTFNFYVDAPYGKFLVADSQITAVFTPN